METFKLSYPAPPDHYLKEIISKNERDSRVSAGTVFLERGHELPFKSLPDHEVSLLVSGELIVYDGDGHALKMESGDFIYIADYELRKTEVVQDSQLVYFLFHGV